MRGIKTGGRAKGTPNKSTLTGQELRDKIQQFLWNNFDNVVSEWEELPPGRDKLNFYRELLKYAIPQLSSMHVTSPIERLPDDQLDALLTKLKEQGYEPQK